MHIFWPEILKILKASEFIFLKLEYFQSWKLAIVRSQGQDLALFGFQFNELLSLLVESLFCQPVWVFLVTQTKVLKKALFELAPFTKEFLVQLTTIEEMNLRDRHNNSKSSGRHRKSHWWEFMPFFSLLYNSEAMEKKPFSDHFDICYSGFCA